ncbi:hypothetical protein E2P84_43015 [Burkholderia cepacia]|uniref:Uncharacterized protein n=1 Tax=Burkholderia cepacia TaxID=292 RepID=A0AAX2RS46_BURCE|nr:hypothetical protein [Burkholderia cepacia]TES61934.1 hypothetical protein E2P84_43015 [Burkholderia cepacia]TET01733.1 hypothetical protein E3D36_17005 [Burkholderia cepacia]TEU47591.1 hypothetical protein E3D37_16435 [Burkholderia cepacia]TEU53463.1 hypothetical protein E3D38_12020 [Burkholderia cepacia]TEV02069.1 hypothetical protein E3D40_12950 [Burkholderia cepacia]
MSITAHLFVLFKSPPSTERLAALAETLSNRVGLPASDFTEGSERMMPVDDADLRADVDDDGALHYCADWRSSKLIGEPTLQGRLYEIGYLTRDWSEGYREGPAVTYALTQLVLLSQGDVEGVWYTNAWCLQFDATIPASTHATIHAMIDEFVATGQTSGDRPTRYIRVDGGVINT